MISSISSTCLPRPCGLRPVADHSGIATEPTPKAGISRPSDKKSIVAHCFARISGSRKGKTTTFIPNCNRSVAPASTAISANGSRFIASDTSRSLVHIESTSPASHNSTHLKKSALVSKGKPAIPSPILSLIQFLTYVFQSGLNDNIRMLFVMRGQSLKGICQLQNFELASWPTYNL